MDFSIDDVELGGVDRRLLLALGHVAREMGILEVVISRQLATMLQMPDDDAALCIVAGENFKWQIGKMRALAMARPDTERRAAFLDCMKRADRLYDRRNELLHATYENYQEDGSAERWRWRRGTTEVGTGERLQAEDIWQFGNRVAELIDDMFKQASYIADGRPGTFPLEHGTENYLRRPRPDDGD